MKEIKIEGSTNIKTIFYYPREKELWVFFKSSSLYIYSKVSSGVVAELDKSKEKGKFFSEYIRNSFDYIRKY
ncbi:MAG: KTSC domain-containing protein [Cetobacterium sp.]